jgi:high-affinity K+ transport system ATPase subunit B
MSGLDERPGTPGFERDELGRLAIAERDRVVVRHVAERFGAPEPADLNPVADAVAKKGATPLAVSFDRVILGVIALSDVLKPGIRDRIAELWSPCRGCRI